MLILGYKSLAFNYYMKSGSQTPGYFLTDALQCHQCSCLQFLHVLGGVLLSVLPLPSKCMLSFRFRPDCCSYYKTLQDFALKFLSCLNITLSEVHLKHVKQSAQIIQVAFSEFIQLLSTVTLSINTKEPVILAAWGVRMCNDAS